DYVGLASPTAGCYFLRADDRCEIEVRHGKALKPGVCSLFPFNDLKRIGGVVVVSPHFLCPLRLRIPARVGEAQGTHAMVTAAALESGLIEADRDGTGI